MPTSLLPTGKAATRRQHLHFQIASHHQSRQLGARVHGSVARGRRSTVHTALGASPWLVSPGHVLWGGWVWFGCVCCAERVGSPAVPAARRWQSRSSPAGPPLRPAAARCRDRPASQRAEATDTLFSSLPPRSP